MSNFGVAALFLATLPAGGMLGSWSRRFTAIIRANVSNEETTSSINDDMLQLEPGFFRIAIPGIAAAFVVPLFLSVGQNAIISQILGSNDIYPILDEILVVFGFCILAGATASNFIDSMAKHALEIADQNRKSIRNIKQENIEQSDIIAEIIENKDGIPAGVEKKEYDSKNLNPKQNIVMSSLHSSRYDKRSATGIARETGLGIQEVRKTLAELNGKGLVVEVPSNRTGSLLYQAVLKE
jgi:hypothetical protein